MDFVIFCFSGTGNTRWAAEELKKRLVSGKNKCELISLDRLKTVPYEKIRSAGAVGFAFPVYGADMPLIVSRLLERMDPTAGGFRDKPAFVLTTAGYADAYGPFEAGKTMRKHGFLLVAYVNVRVSINISLPGGKAAFPSAAVMKRRLERGEKALDRLAGKLTEGKRHITNAGPNLLPGAMIRKATKKRQEEQYQALSVDSTRCIRCMSCVRDCPTESIIFKDGDFTFMPSCTACFRCYNFCPAFAVLINGRYAAPEGYERYQGPESLK